MVAVLDAASGDARAIVIETGSPAAKDLLSFVVELGPG